MRRRYSFSSCAKDAKILIIIIIIIIIITVITKWHTALEERIFTDVVNKASLFWNPSINYRRDES